MPTSDLARTDAYAHALDRFAGGVPPGNVVAAYHAVRAIPYGSGPDRTPLAALQAHRGACTAKHLILRDLLARRDVTSEVELVEGDFASGFDVTPEMPDDLATMVREGGVRDIHARVRARGQVLDATWPDTMRGIARAVNDGWDGCGDTASAIPQVAIVAAGGDVLATKARLLAGFPPDDTDRRRRFLTLLTDWLGQRPRA